MAAACLPAAVGVLVGVPAGSMGERRSGLDGELAQLRRPRLLLVLALGALVNGATFCTFTYLAPVATEVAGLGPWWVPVLLVAFGTGSFVGVTVAGRIADRRPALVVALGGGLLLAGWIALALSARHPAALIGLAVPQGALSFAVGGTLISRVLHEATGAPTMAGSYATAALNVGAAAGPTLGGLAMSTPLGVTAPIWASAALVAVALSIAARSPWTLGRPSTAL